MEPPAKIVQFVSKKQREESKRRQEEEEKAKEAERKRELDRKRQDVLRKRSRSRSPRDKDQRDVRGGTGHYRKRREDEEEVVEKKDEKKFLIEEREVEMIKDKYYGIAKEKRKVIKPGDKFKQVFVFEWDASEDTSQDINPLYAKKHDPKILFGKGYMGGVDQNEQKKNYD